METGWKPNVVVELSPACPRCGSSNTKFCYYNNYSLTQPRYFCKGCRRYWTKGGSLRNVPIGGGCRKSRRGRSIRAGAATASSRNLADNNNGLNIQSSSSNNNSISHHHQASTSIDLAAVYANFLNQGQWRENQISNNDPLISELDNRVLIPPSMEFSDFQGLHNVNQLSSHLANSQESHHRGFFEYCGHFPARLPEAPPLLGGGSSMFFAGLNAFQKELSIPGNSFNNACSMNNTMENAVLMPPLPGEGILTWQDYDVGLSSNPVLPPATTDETRGGVELGGQNSELLSGNVSPFSALNLEAIFRS